MGIRNLLCCCLLFMGTNSQFIEYSNSTIRDKRQNTSYKCTLPQHPPNGRWMIINGDGNPGDEIEINTIVKLECIDGYRLEPPQPFMFCNSEWDPSAFPKCQKKCPAFYSTATTALKCDENGKNVHCDQAIDGTYLTSKCIPYYEVPPGSKSTLYCTGGTWSFPKPVCQPVCGKKVNNETKPLSWRGNDVKDLEYPWVIALYQKIGSKFKNICGGTMVSRRVVLTAAHCVTNDYGNVLPKEDFQIAAGKYYNAYDDERDEQAQFRELAKLIVHDDYRGESRRYVADIAIIITKILFRLGPYVQPVCINNIDSIYLTNRQMGEVAGWGLTEHNRAAERLRVVKVPYKEGATCSRELPPEWEEKYNFFDKICAGHFQKNISVCQGDSGSGLVFKNSEDNRYYIHGIVSIAPNLYTSQCNYETNALYTSIAKHYGFIDREMTKYYVEDCVLPKHPKNGQWQLENDADKSPGDIVPSTSILKYSCNRGYKLSSASEFFECKNTYNPPTCTVRCRKLSFPAGTNTICKNNKEQVIDCEEASEGSSITFTCPKGYTSDQGTQSSTRYCINGLYGTPRPDCVFGRVAKPKPTTSHSVGADGTKVICTYVSQWAYQGVLPEDFDPNMCTHLVYDFIGIWDKGDVRVQDDALDLDQEERGLYNRVNDLKKKNKNLKVLLSVGGEATSNTTLFTRVSRNARKTGGFLGSAGHFIKTYHFDGLNIDWQYPDEDDAGNYIRFLETIKDEFDRNNWILSASVRPDFDKTGYNIKEMNRLLHWVTIKTYDFYDAFSSYTGSHNALFPSSKENKWGKDHLNIENVAGNWLKAGLSKEKMVLSVAFHGRSFILKDKAQHGIHAPVTGPGPGVDGGVLRYYEICSKYKNGFQEGWDDETKSAYRYNDTVWISFNTKDTVWTRGEYIKKNGYAGINIYPWDGDDNKGICGERYILLKHVNGGLGYPMAWNET